jgi:hypothetical protein
VSLILLPHEASAHLVSTGLGPIYDGAWHFAQTPSQILALIALALFAGLRGPAHARQCFFLLPPAWLVGCLLRIALPAALAALLPACTLLIIGGLLASELRLPPVGIGVLAVLSGLVLGVSYGATLEGPAGPYAVGAIVTTIVLLALLSSLALPLKWLPGRIAVRVAGSWTSALGLLLAGWWIHGGQ